VQLAHSAQDSLAALLVGGDAEGRILGGQLLQGHAQLFLVGLGFGLDRDLDERPWDCVAHGATLT
jgi:hypothetical protein